MPKDAESKTPVVLILGSEKSGALMLAVVGAHSPGCRPLVGVLFVSSPTGLAFTWGGKAGVLCFGVSGRSEPPVCVVSFWGLCVSGSAGVGCLAPGVGEWAAVNFQSESTVLFYHLVAFHDFTILVLSMILAFVGLVIYGMVQKTSFISRSLYTHHSLEFIWTLLPVVVLVTVAIPSLTLLFMMEDSSSAFLTTKVTGYQWYWSYHMPVMWDGSCGVREDAFSYLHAGLGKSGMFRLLDTTQFMPMFLDVPIRVLVSSGDVLHSWTVPSMGVKADACPGRLNEVVVTPSRTGTFFGQCSEICGSNHSFMPIEVKVLSWG